MAYQMSGKELEKVKSDTALEEAGESKVFEASEKKQMKKGSAKKGKKVPAKGKKGPAQNQELTG